MTEPITDPVLLRYLAGECSAEESAEIARRLAADPVLASQIAKLRAMSHAWSETVHAGDDTAAWHRMQSRVTATPTVPRREPRANVWTYRFTGLLAAGLCVAALSLGSAWFAGRHSARQAFHEFSTASGNRTTITLRDGTRLVLAPATRIQVPADFGLGGTRQITLEGEAYFAVVHDQQHPFTVQAHGVVTQDVGTAFDVRAYRDDPNVRVAVVEGAVALVGAGRGTARRLGGSRTRPSFPTGNLPSFHDSRPRPSFPTMMLHADDVATPPSFPTTMLHAGNVATTTGDQVMVAHQNDMTMFTAWMQGGLAFADTPLRQAVQDIGRTFGMQITIADSALANKLITATFQNEPVDEVLDVITSAIGAAYDRTGHAIVIRLAMPSRQYHPHQSPAPLSTASALKP